MLRNALYFRTYDDVFYLALKIHVFYLTYLSETIECGMTAARVYEKL